MTKFLLDANLSRKMVRPLVEELGIDLESLQGLGLGELPDHLIAQYSARHRRVVISPDKDWESADTGLFENSGGVIRLKLVEREFRTIPAMIGIIVNFFRVHADSIDLERSLVVVTETSVNVIRTLPPRPTLRPIPREALSDD